MAGLKRLPSASLIETLVALTIIMTLFGISVSIFLSINKVNDLKGIKASMLLQAYINETTSVLSTSEAEKEVDGFLLKRQVKLNNSNSVHYVFSVYTMSGTFVKRLEKVILKQ